MKYRKNPIVIDAWQFDGSVASFEHFVADALGSSVVISGTDKHGQPTVTFSGATGALAQVILAGTTIVIPTLEGDMEASAGDWIIRGVKGEYYPCKPDVFAASYQAVNS